MPTRLKLRNNRYSCRLRAPRDCRIQFGVEITRDLGTAVRRDADRLARKLTAEYQGLFASVRTCAAARQPIADPRALVHEVADWHLGRPLITLEAGSPAGLAPCRPEMSPHPETPQALPARVADRPSPGRTLADALTSLVAEKTARGQYCRGTISLIVAPHSGVQVTLVKEAEE